MAESYRISATPLLYREGKHKGQLNGVTFRATSENDIREWFTINCGQLEDAFTQLMSRGRARAIVAGLMEGDVVELPGLYVEEQFRRGFVYEWSCADFAGPLPLRQAACAY